MGNPVLSLLAYANHEREEFCSTVHSNQMLQNQKPQSQTVPGLEVSTLGAKVSLFFLKPYRIKYFLLQCKPDWMVLPYTYWGFENN